MLKAATATTCYVTVNDDLNVYVCDDSIKHQLVSVSRHCCGRGVEREQLARVSVAIRQVSRRALILGALPVRRSAVYLSCIPLLPPPPTTIILPDAADLPFKTSPLMPLLLLSVFGQSFKSSYIGTFQLSAGFITVL